MGFLSNIFGRFQRRVVSFLTGGSFRSRRIIRELEEQAITRSILDTNASYTAKASVHHVTLDVHGRIAQVHRRSHYAKLFERPNPYMTLTEFLYAVSWQLDAKNTALAWVQWEGNKPVSIWPIAYTYFQIVKVDGGGYAVDFTDMDGQRHLCWLDDMVVMRQHYDGDGISGRGNDSILPTLQLVEELDDSLSSAVNVANKIHGIVQAKKAMLAPEAVEKSQKEFKQRVLEAAEDGSGIIVMDSTESYTPVSVPTWAASAEQMDKVEQRLYTFWRTPKSVVDNTANEQTIQNFLESRIEWRWKMLSEAFTFALFTRREQDFGNRIVLFGGAAAGASMGTRLKILAETKETGELTTNERRELLGFGPVDGGDERVVSLNFVKATDQSRYQLGEAEPEPESVPNLDTE